MVDVDHDRVGWNALVMVVVLLGVTIEKLEVIQACEWIALGGLDNLPVFAQLDGTPNTSTHHAGIGVWLLDKVACPGV